MIARVTAGFCIPSRDKCYCAAIVLSDVNHLSYRKENCNDKLQSHYRLHPFQPPNQPKLRSGDSRNILDGCPAAQLYPPLTRRSDWGKTAAPAAGNAPGRQGGCAAAGASRPAELNRGALWLNRNDFREHWHQARPLRQDASKISVVVSENRQKHEQCPYNKNDKTSPILCASRNELWTYPVIESPPLLYSTQSRAKPHFLAWSPNNLREAQTLQHAPSRSLSLRRSAGPRCVCLLVSQHTQLRSVTGRFLCLSTSHLCQRHPHLLHPVACSGITATRLAFPSQLWTVSVTKPHKPHKQLLNQFLLSVFKAASVAQETSLSHFICCNRLSATLPVAPLTFSSVFHTAARVILNN